MSSFLSLVLATGVVDPPPWGLCCNACPSQQTRMSPAHWQNSQVVYASYLNQGIFEDTFLTTHHTRWSLLPLPSLCSIIASAWRRIQLNSSLQCIRTSLLHSLRPSHSLPLPVLLFNVSVSRVQLVAPGSLRPEHPMPLQLPSRPHHKMALRTLRPAEATSTTTKIESQNRLRNRMSRRKDGTSRVS